MAGAPAYSYNNASAAPPRQPQQSPRTRPAITVVPGRKHQAQPDISPTLRTLCVIAVVVMACFLVLGLARVGIAASAYEVASQASDMRAHISDARSVQESLAVEKSSVANPITLRAEAADRLHMAAPQSVGTLSLPADVVVYDGVGNLSLTQSIASVATLS